MNWEAVGAISEGIGAIAVVITLIYLSRQMKQNTHSTSMGVYQHILDQIGRINDHIANNEEFRDLIRRLSDPAYEATQEEKDGLFPVMLNAMRNWHHAFEMYQTGLLSEEQWKSFKAGIDRVLERGMLQRDLDTLLEGLPEDFQQLIRNAAAASAFQLKS